MTRPDLIFDFQAGERADPEQVTAIDREPGFDPADAFRALDALLERKAHRIAEDKRAKQEETANSQRKGNPQPEILPEDQQDEQKHDNGGKESPGTKGQATTT